MKLLNFAVSYMHKWNRNFLPTIVFMANMPRFLFIIVWLPFPSRSEVRLETKTFLLIFIVPIVSQKFILDSPFHIYKDIPEGQAMSDSFWSIMSNIPHMRFLPIEEKKTTKKQQNFWEIVYCNLETELCKHWVKSVTLSLMKVAKSPGGLKSTVCLCLREHSWGTGGGKVVKLWESRLTERWDREGELWSIVNIDVLTQLRPPDRFQAPTNRCFICVCLPTLL